MPVIVEYDAYYILRTQEDIFHSAAVSVFFIPDCTYPAKE